MQVSQVGGVFVCLHFERAGAVALRHIAQVHRPRAHLGNVQHIEQGRRKFSLLGMVYLLMVHKRLRELRAALGQYDAGPYRHSGVWPPLRQYAGNPKGRRYVTFFFSGQSTAPMRPMIPTTSDHSQPDGASGLRAFSVASAACALSSDAMTAIISFSHRS